MSLCLWVAAKGQHAMKIQFIQISKIILSRCGKLLAPAVLAGFPACAALNSLFKTADSPLPVESVHSPSGQIASVRAFESSDKLYVAGSTQRTTGYAIHYATHVDIELIGRDGRVLAEKEDDIDAVSPRQERTRQARYSYVASFPLSEARQAAKIRVAYHSAKHASAN